MNPTTESNGKRGRKPADKWSFKYDTGIPQVDEKGQPIMKDGKPVTEKTLEISIDVGSPDDCPSRKAEWLEIGHRQAARQAFQEEFSKIAPAIAKNGAALAEVIAAFDPSPEQLAKFKAGKVFTFPTEWTFKPTPIVQTAPTTVPTTESAADVKPGEKKPKSK